MAAAIFFFMRRRKRNSQAGQRMPGQEPKEMNPYYGSEVNVPPQYYDNPPTGAPMNIKPVEIGSGSEVPEIGTPMHQAPMEMEAPSHAHELDSEPTRVER